MAFALTEGFGQLWGQFLEAKRSTGKSLTHLLWEALRLRYGETGIGFNEFFGYELYDTSRLSPETIRSFVSDSVANQIWETMNPPKHWGLVNDKVSFLLIMERLGFVQPKLIALFSKQGRVLPGVLMLQTTEDVASFLSDTEAYPLFAKPNDSFRSLGAFGVSGYNAKGCSLELTNGHQVALAEFAEQATSWRSYLFQEKLAPHPSLAEFSGASLSTIRIVTLFGAQGPEVFRIVWKVPKNANMADNFWRSGNIIAHIDYQTGKVYSVVQSTDPGHKQLGNDSPLGRRFLDSSPPEYEEAIELVLTASRVFPMFAFQAWDIALTDKGPVALEMNHNGDFGLLQVGAREGILDDRFRSLLCSRNIKLKNTKRILARKLFRRA